MEEKVKTARLSVISNTLLILLKVFAGILSGSVSILSEAIHSGMDLLASIIAFFSVKVSDKAPDAQHPYGHGKFENVSGVVEAVLIFIAAGWIIYEAIEKILGKTEGFKTENSIIIGSAIMFISALVNTYVSQKLYKVAKKTDSIALEADALHLKTDVYTSLGVGLGLLLIWLSGKVFSQPLYFLDPIIAMGVALLIIKESVVLLRNAYSPLLDSSLSENEIRIITNCIKKHDVSFHNLKTRKSGQFRFADLHLELPSSIDLKNAHDLCDAIENEIQSKIKNIEINIHMEPVDEK
jgi:cation diffusion facilitator family transporter